MSNLYYLICCVVQSRKINSLRTSVQRITRNMGSEIIIIIIIINFVVVIMDGNVLEV